MNNLLFKKSENNFYLFDKKPKIIAIVKKRRFEKITLGIIIDTAMKIPPNTGFTYRLYYLSKKLNERGLRVKIFLCNRNFPTDKKVQELNKKNSYLEFHILPEDVFYNSTKLEEIIRANAIDILQAEEAVHILHFFEVSRNLKIPFCLEMHDVEASIKRSLGYDREEVDFTGALIYFAASLAEKVMCMTPLDYSELISKIGVEKEKLTLVPNPVNLQEFSYYGPNLKTKNIIFVGNMFYWPNQNAVNLIARKIYPSVVKRVKEARFIMVGMVPEGVRRRFSQKDFIFTGSVDDLNSYLKEATIALCPVVEGSGMKVKILNYCAAGLPVITTKIGASGYEKISSLIVENDLNKYPELIANSLNNPRKLKSLGEKNRKAVEKDYDVNKIVDKAISVYQETLNTFYLRTMKRGQVKELKIPLPLWLQEKRIKYIRNINYYAISNGRIIKTKV